MKAYLIDPFAKTVSEIEYDGNYTSIYKLISSESKKVDTFTCVNINEQEDTIFVDDEGLLGNLATQYFFSFNGNLLAGKGLVLGTNEEGESVSPQVSLNDMQKENEIVFLSPEQVNHVSRGFRIK